MALLVLLTVLVVTGVFLALGYFSGDRRSLSKRRIHHRISRRSAGSFAACITGRAG